MKLPKWLQRAITLPKSMNSPGDAVRKYDKEIEAALTNSISAVYGNLRGASALKCSIVIADAAASQIRRLIPGNAGMLAQALLKSKIEDIAKQLIDPNRMPSAAGLAGSIMAELRKIK